MKLIRTQDAAGHVLCHDMTQIIRGVKKDAVFRKGHIVTEQDIPVLLSIGKEHLYVWEKDDDHYHEDEAAQILKEICLNRFMTATPTKEGKVEIIADCPGLFKINREKLLAINSLGEIMIATRHDNFAVEKGDKLAGARVIPLVIHKSKMQRAKQIAGHEPIMSIVPFRKLKVGLVITGSEIYHGRIKDAFGPVIKEKMDYFGAEIIGQHISDDKPQMIAGFIRELLGMGADVIACTGGMSVDPDDTTPSAIKSLGAEIVTYGVPVLPGAMFLLAYIPEGIPVLGLPGCVMYAKRTIFDLVLPRVMAGEKLTSSDLFGFGKGGLCLECAVCTFPNCGFGK